MKDGTMKQMRDLKIIVGLTFTMCEFLETERARCELVRCNPSLYKLDTNTDITVEQRQVWMYRELLYGVLLQKGEVETLKMAESLKNEFGFFYPAEFMSAFVDVQIKVTFFQKKNV